MGSFFLQSSRNFVDLLSMTSTIGVQSFKVLARPWRALCTCNVPRAKIFAVELLAYLYFNFHEILQTCSSWLVLLVCEVSNFLRDHDAHYARAKFRASKYFEFNRFQKSYDLLMSSLNILLLSLLLNDNICPPVTIFPPLVTAVWAHYTRPRDVWWWYIIKRVKTSKDKIK